jgi:hypothetical protein
VPSSTGKYGAVLHRIATPPASMIDFLGIILWGWCGQESRHGAVVLKDAKGYIRVTMRKSRYQQN